MDAWLADSLSSTKELARLRGQSPSTAHLLAALYRCDSSVRLLCSQFGMRDVTLVAELVWVEERETAIALALERAKKLAVAMGMHRMLPLHLLHVLAHARHSAANRVLFRLGVAPERLSQAALDRLEAATSPQPTAAPAEAERTRRDSASVMQLGAVRRERARADVLSLGEEVEKRLPRGARPLDRPPPTFADEVEVRLRRARRGSF